VKKLDEKLSLLRMAQAFGVAPDPKLLDEIKYLQEQEDKKLKQQAELKERVHAASQSMFEAPAIEKKDIKEEVLFKTQPKPLTAPEQIADFITRNPVKEATIVQGEPVLAQGGGSLAAQVKRLEAWVSKIGATGPGGGEVNLRWLDDVDRTNITDGQYLRYDGPTKKFTFDAGHHNNYYLAVQSSQTQTSNATSATAMTFNVIDANFGITITSNSIIVIPNPGTYNVQFSSQFVNTGNTPDDVYVWFRQNGTNVPSSNSTATIPAKDNSNVPGKTILSLNYFVTTTSNNETLQLMWFVVDDTHVSMPYISSIAATATTPEIPGTASVILTVSPVR
jgi:hypothetical protein